MAERLKDRFFSDKFIKDLGSAIKRVYPDFDQPVFTAMIYADNWEGKELKQRMSHISHSLKAALPGDYAASLKILTTVAPGFEGFDAMIFPDYVEKYGLDDWDLSLPALALFTTLCSSEFAIRPFIARNSEKAMGYMYRWARDDDFHLRRLASEGCRPRLPWAMALPVFKKDPTLILPVLEILKDDAEKYVQMSVANNLNDISKDHPELVLDICERWYGYSKNTDWIVKRACRTMLKEGNTRALILFGFSDPGQISVEDLSFDRSKLAMGEGLRFSFDLRLKEKKTRRVRLEYGVDFIKANGKSSRKIFQIREADYEGGSHTISRKHSFRDLSTRKHYPGPHLFTMIVNGVPKAAGSVELL